MPVSMNGVSQSVLREKVVDSFSSAVPVVVIVNNDDTAPDHFRVKNYPSSCRSNH